MAADGAVAVVLGRPEIAADEIRYGDCSGLLYQILELVSSGMTHTVRRWQCDQGSGDSGQLQRGVRCRYPRTVLEPLGLVSQYLSRKPDALNGARTEDGFFSEHHNVCALPGDQG